MNRLRQFVESIVYAGMKPGNERDPFYLTNRTAGQRLRLAAVIGIPLALAVGAVVLVSSGYFRPHARSAASATALTTQQEAAKMLPKLDQDLRIPSNHDIDVLDAHIEPGSITKVAGMARNNTDHAIENAMLIFNLTNAVGSRLGAVSTTIARIDPKTTIPFSFVVEQREAAFALVREIRER